MAKSALILALLLFGSIGGCDRDEDLVDTLTSGTWRVDYYFEDGDERTSVFHGYVFTFLRDGTVAVTVAPQNTQLPPGTWDEDDNGTILELNFGDVRTLETLNEDWVVDIIKDDEIRTHRRSAPANLLYFERR